ncbi:MAG: type II toxin-antitoxin system PemK/MazF family toxin [Spirochaetota bacterium]|nr:type II toxin-antitoxin system PemK/MazF family toxin [Spirochaetota bacterium]
MVRGDVWLINLDPTIGEEIRKTRPVIIVNDNEIGILPLKVIVPITDWKNHYTLVDWMVKIEPDSNNGLEKTSAIDTFQVRSVSQQRFIKHLGQISDSLLKQVSYALSLVLSIPFQSDKE